MAAYAAVASLMNNIDQIMIHPRLSSSLHKKPIRSLLNTAGFLLDFIEGYGYGAGSKEFEEIERGIARAAHAAEDVIESHIVDQIQRRSNRTSRRCLRDLQRIIRDMNAIVKRADELRKNEGLRLREEERRINSRPPLMEIEGTEMVGFEEELIRIMDELTNRQSSRRIVSIVGMGGMGKTTLAHNVYENLLIKQYFDIRAWATVSQQCNVVGILSQLVSGQGKPSDRTVDGLGEQLHKSLSGRRYLIVLDDIWSVEGWNEIRYFFPNNGNGSRVVLTTRMSNVARDCCSSSSFTIEPLDEHQRWRLFCRKAFEQENCPYPELEKVGKEIARLCRGLPLSTVVIGGLLLKSPRSVELWENVVRNIQLVPDSKEKEESLDILSLSYDHLPPHLKPCFLYLGAFKEDSNISVSKIIRLWIAEGFLRPKNSHVLEEVGEGYFKELIDRNLVSVSGRRHNGKIRYCGIHDLVRDLCLKVGMQQEFFHDEIDEIQGSERRLIGSVWTHLPFNRLRLAPSSLTGGEQSIRGIERHRIGSVCPHVLYNGVQVVRSILGRGTLNHSVEHKLLRVWDEGWLDSLVEVFGNVNLRYLDHRHSFYYPYVLKLPSSVSLIWNLQTLIITYSCELVFAPIEIWEMRQLRHIKCSQIHLPHPCLNDGFSAAVYLRDCKLYNLQTLKTTVNFRLSEEVCKMIPNINKLGLVYDGELQGYDDSLVEFLSNLDSLHKLKALKLSFRGKLGQKVAKTVRFPILLNKLSLYGCHLEWEELTMIGLLPHLEALELIAHLSWTGPDKWSPIEGQFLRLKFLKMDKCILEYWYADKSNFPVLEKLVLIDMCYLKEIPSGIGEIATLELIRVDYCTESAAISAVRIKEDQLENEGNDVLRVEVVVKDDSELVLFEKMVEAEGLTVDHIQLESRR